MDHRFWLGPIGDLRPLPDVLTSVDVSRSWLGGVHRGLGGGATNDVQAVKGAWGWSGKTLLPHQVAYIDALQEGVAAGPLRLVDPRKANRLPAQVASGGSQRRSPTGFVCSAGDVAHRALSTAPAPSASLPPRNLLRGALAWTIPAVGGGQLGITRAATVGLSAIGGDVPWRVPLLTPGGAQEQVVLSGYACAAFDTLAPADTTVPAVFSRVDRDAAGVETQTASPRVRELSAAAWTPLRWTFTPKRAAVDSTPQLTIPLGNPACTVFFTGAMWAVAGAESLPPSVHTCDAEDSGGGWRVGGGAPEVVVADPGSHTYPGLPWFHDVALTLVEV